MKTRDVKKIIQQFAEEEFILYPDSFPRERGQVTNCCTENITQWALNMWESRTDEEVTRDFQLGLNADVYIAWAFEAFKKTSL